MHLRIPRIRPTRTAGTAPRATPDTTTVGGGVLVGLVASLCCGGSLLLGSVGLGTLYATLGLWRYVAQFLAVGAVSIVALNWWYYRRKARRGGVCGPLRRAMFVSAALGLGLMVGSFVLLEWLNHGVVHDSHPAAVTETAGHAAHGHGTSGGDASDLVLGVANGDLATALATLIGGLGLLVVLPFPRQQPAPRVPSPDG
jgi:hypothetical protein